MALDRLSELPESLIHEILSLLPVRKAAATSILSKRWKNVWTTVPRLHFHQITDVADPHKFPKFVYRVLARWKGGRLLKFSIQFDLDHCSDTDADRWLHFAMKKQVEELRIESRLCSSYSPPTLLYTCSSIRKLTFVFVELYTDESLRWDKLESLTYEGTCSWIEESIDDILSGAPVLQVLNLLIEEVLENFKIESESLKVFKIDYFVVDPCHGLDVVLRIDAPNLESLEMSKFWNTRCLFKVPSLKNAILGYDNRNDVLTDNKPHELVEKKFRLALESISHVENLTLNEWSFKLLVDQMKDGFFVPFPNAKSLKLYARESEGLLRALNMFTELEMLEIEQTEFPYYFLAEPQKIFPDLSLLQLKRVVITWDVLDTSMIDIVGFLLGRAQVLEKLVLRFRNDDVHNPEWFISAQDKVMKMARSSLNAEMVVRRC